ncbi:unnamed protein product [Zymoseptoria tritici ST99CH_1A5]|uniref:F-box domain-containing protein n=4 Tax=Zymoseptoria tritici TaxID=1047171 RepID=F9XCP9_ZYMTI|nr:uncharacterized protein MYCGRDRAFT_93695 [Zymoseptoria tritici IPO323]SMQ51485.1 unnamed protein product [Zymoseptoria tritici ST99CH_3D7]SMR53561.1 unnamed protein product [Zymoseptoria tritici ST99CH_1E4]SMR55938.1 unnamed protein product [Zymoseptoria tritici ST99CH_3D1]SMY25127.1 unnamed protein product [Zymoseptoria tritici ST99CH_1A5]EGP86344.1 hypothetical protein MYCGRDRAFT_93695 [Zymoseptoria tritici IPO323]
MTLPKYALNYQNCDLTELRKFYIQRHALTDISGIAVHDLTKGELIAALESLDHTSTFHFLDLAPELRLMVYPHLLSHHYNQTLELGPPSPASAFPEILRASKLCYKEARDILYEQSSLTLYFFGEEEWSGEPLEVQGDVKFRDYGEVPDPHGLSSRLTPFADVQYVNILIVDFDNPTNPGPSTGVAYLFAAIVSTFRAGNSLKAMVIKFKSHHFDGLEEVGNASPGVDGIATSDDVEDFDKTFRTLLRLQKLPATIRLELVDFRKATSSALRGLLKEMEGLRL